MKLLLPGWIAQANAYRKDESRMAGGEKSEEPTVEIRPVLERWQYGSKDSV